jgi:hypothetical protein
LVVVAAAAAAAVVNNSIGRRILFLFVQCGGD